MNNMKFWTRCLPIAVLMLNFVPLGCLADQVVTDDLVVTGSACIGSDCIPDQAFGFDTLQIRAPDPSILLQDTSSGSFPTNDWRLGVQDGATPGGPSVFYFEDVTNGTPALQIEAGPGGGIALGTGATLESGAVSVGAAGDERRITNVAAGINATDAVNMAQFQQFQDYFMNELVSGGLEAEFQSQVDALNLRFDRLDHRLSRLSTRLDKMAAASAAFSAVQANPKAQGNTQIGLGLGNQTAESAVAIGVYRFAASDQLMYNVGVSVPFGGGKALSRAGVTFGW